MTLYEKIIFIHPTLAKEDFYPFTGSIVLQNDGQGDYIKLWENSNAQPTQEQLDAIAG